MSKKRQIKIRRRTYRKEMQKNAGKTVDEFRMFINELPLNKRIKLAWRIIRKTY